MPKILLCVSGGIAAYKAIDLASRMHKLGWDVRTVLTANTLKFVSGLNFAAITGAGVHTSLFEDSDPIPHISLADWADLVVVAPATANVIAKASQGIADDLLSSLLLAHTKPVLFVPAMNVNMYQHPATQAHLAMLRQRQNHILEPDTGLLACGYEGRGKYPPNEEVLYAIRAYLKYKADLAGKKVLVTAGATSEAIDPMRMITNNSSGKLGLALARAFALRGAKVTLVYGRIDQPVPYYLEQALYTPSAEAMQVAVLKEAPMQDIIVKCAAVSDYKPPHPETEKIKKGRKLDLELVPTPDILAELGRSKSPGQKLIGFAAETRNLIPHALAKLRSKNLDLICVNHLETAGADTTTLTLISASQSTKKKHPVLAGDKFDVALQLVDQIIRL